MKRTTTIKNILLILIATTLAYCSKDNTPPTPPVTLNIGDVYQGGIIFYLNNTGEHGLICALYDQNTNAVWGCQGTEILAGTSSALGSGNDNTNNILADCSSSNIAAYYCANFTVDTYDDWYLPSLEELKLMHHQKDVINNTATANAGAVFFSNNYWSSTSAPGNIDAFGVDFSLPANTSSQIATLNTRSSTQSVRAIRSF